MASRPASVWLAPTAAGLTALALVAIGLQEGRGFPAARKSPATAASATMVHVPFEDRAAIRDWPSFFGCYGLVDDDAVIIATLRANGFPFDAARPIRLVLAPPRMRDIQPEESAVIREIGRQRAISVREGKSGCQS